MTILHMDIDVMHSTVQQLKQSLEQMRTFLHQPMDRVSALDWSGPSRDEFVTEYQQAFRSLDSQLENGRVLVERVEREIQEWEQVASSLAGAYGGLLERLQNVVMPAHAWFGASSLSGGAVLAATASINAIDNGSSSASAIPDVAQYQAMNWSDKFAEQKRLNGEITRVTGQLPVDPAEQIQRIDGELSELDQKIADLQAKREAADRQAKGFLNQIKPDWPLQRDKQDGLPWRVQADDYEDQVSEYDRQIAELQNRRAELLSQQSLIKANLEKLPQLKAQKAALDAVIQQGIATDGPSAKYPYFPGTEADNCTKYASSRRNVPCNGNAYQWNEQAEKAGYEVGSLPVKGAVMVFERDPNGKVSNSQYGHVAIVDHVQDLGNGKYEVSLSEGGWGDRTKVNHRTIQVDASGSGSSYKNVSVSYIYGEKHK